jgi:hypothetical protein
VAKHVLFHADLVSIESLAILELVDQAMAPAAVEDPQKKEFCVQRVFLIEKEMSASVTQIKLHIHYIIERVPQYFEGAASRSSIKSKANDSDEQGAKHLRQS